MSDEKRVVVIGAGMAGLVAALSLQKQGFRVTIIERRSKAGGLCGTFMLNGFEFVTACNDFGQGLVKLLRQLGVRHRFMYKKSRVLYSGKWFDASPNLSMLIKLRSEWRNMLSLAGGIIAQQSRKRSPQSIESFVDQHAKPGAVNDLAKIVSYFMGVAPYDIMTSFFGFEKKFGYGYTKMACPEGGPQALVDSLVNAFLVRGGSLELETAYVQHRKGKSGFSLLARADGSEFTVEADYVVDTTGNRSLYPEEVKQGLPLSILCLAVDDRFEYPADTHTLSFYEPGVSYWFACLDKGISTDRFGFHVFKSDLRGNPPGVYTINAYFYLPRGLTQLNDHQRSEYTGRLFEGLGELLPGIQDFILFHQIITPEDFVQTHGLSSRVMPYISHDFKPPICSDVSGYFRAGHTIYPPGEHAGAAALSGYLAAASLAATNSKALLSCGDSV